MTDQLLDRLVVAVGTQYLVDAEIGRGGMSVVYRATDLRLQRRVAIKVLPPELAFNADVRERFLREAQTSAGLTHPSIVPIFTVDEREGIVYFVMALVDGESLGERLSREPRLPVADVRRILSGTADALAYAHAHGVVHRDIKPDNIMLDRATGRPVVTDFGIARAAQGDTRLTVTGVAIGTPAYMSPEQAMGERELDGRSDIYSLGVIGYQMLAGEPPFKATNTPAMLMKHLSETPRPLHSLRGDAPSGLVHAIARALAKKPDDRWADAASFREALSAAEEMPPFADQSLLQRDPPHHAERPAERAAQPPAFVPPPMGQPFRGLVPPAYPHLVVQPMMPMESMSAFASRASRKEMRRQGRRDRHNSDAMDAVRPIEERITSLRRKAVGALGTIGSLFAVNMITSPHHPWFVFPSAFIALGVATRAGKLWADGVPVARIFSRGDAARGASSLATRALAPADAALALAPADVLDGRYGDAVRRAADDRAAVIETVSRLAVAEREMIPDVAPTVDALAQKVGSLATTLHRLDADVGSSSAATLDERIAALRDETRGEPTTEQERRLALLVRQRATLTELVQRRTALVSRLESACLALQNLRLDLLKLRSSGLGGGAADLASATQEARALSREIGYAVDAAREVRDL